VNVTAGIADSRAKGAILLDLGDPHAWSVLIVG
jgi:hypothetical protein